MALRKKPVEIVQDGKHILLVKAEHWDRIFLMDIAEVQNGFAFHSKKFTKEQGIPLIRIRDIANYDTENYYNGEYDECFIVKKGEILIGMDGDFNAARWKGNDGLLNQRVCRLKPFFKDYDEKFLFLCLQPYLNAINEETSSVTVKHLSSKTIEEIPLPFPKLDEQKIIVSKIDALFSELDNAIVQLKTSRQQLRVYRRAVLKKAFEGRLTNEIEKGRKLAEGWKQVKIQNVADCFDNKRKPINKEHRLKRQGNIPYYGANGRTGWIDDYLFDEPLVLVVEDETFVGRELPFSYKITGKSWVNNHAHILKPKEHLNIDFLNYQLAYYPFLPLTTGTTGRKKLTKNALMNADFRICSLEEQNRIVLEIESRLSVADKLEESITISLQQAETLRQSILKKAFEGKLV